MNIRVYSLKVLPITKVSCNIIRPSTYEYVYVHVYMSIPSRYYRLLRSLVILYVHLLMNIRVYSLKVLPITASYAFVFPTLCIYWSRVILTVNVITLYGFAMTLCVYCKVLNECLYIFRLPRDIKEIKNLHKPNVSPSESLYLQGVCRVEVKFYFTFNPSTIWGWVVSLTSVSLCPWQPMDKEQWPLPEPAWTLVVSSLTFPTVNRSQVTQPIL